jgi:hypothetical protein
MHCDEELLDNFFRFPGMSHRAIPTVLANGTTSTSGWPGNGLGGFSVKKRGDAIFKEKL